MQQSNACTSTGCNTIVALMHGCVETLSNLDCKATRCGLGKIPTLDLCKGSET